MIPAQSVSFTQDTVTVQRQCTVSKKLYSVSISVYQWADWKSGKLIQDAMPDLSDDQREFLITNTTPEEWNEMWGGEE